jgi:hypothetical protein
MLISRRREAAYPSKSALQCASRHVIAIGEEGAAIRECDALGFAHDMEVIAGVVPEEPDVGLP